MLFLNPWYAENNPSLSEKLHRELPVGHVLFGVSASAIARRQDRDDVLFVLLDGSNRVAVVHFTWNKETEPIWPITVLFTSIDEWAKTMHKDHSDYVA